jgi:membrane fusion protein (multidrug efflux system)
VAEEVKPGSPHRKAWIWGFIFVVLIAAILVFIWWFFCLRFEEYTDDAYVSGNMVSLTPQISGIVTSINADETNIVEKDQLIIELDSTDASLAFEKQKAEFAETLRTTIGMFEKVGQKKAEMDQKKALFWKSALDYEHRRDLVDFGGVSIEDFQHAEADLQAAYASLTHTEHGLISALAQIANTTVLSHPLVEKSQEKLKEAYVQLQRCKIVAPVSGMIAQRNAQVGQQVHPGSKLLAIVPLEEMWVYANYKEVQLRKMRVGQPVRMTSDIYGKSLIFHGKIIGLAAGTGSVFSIIPPQNATGNWIKIVQRLPVKISLDPDDLKEYPLRLGLSMEVKVDLHDLDGSSLPRPKPLTPIYETDVFGKQLEGVNQIVSEIIEANVAPLFLDPQYFDSLLGKVDGE